MKNLTVLFFAVLLLSSCSKMQSFESKDYGYTVKYPEGWTLEKKGEYAMFKSPKPEGDSFVENVNIMVQELNDEVNDIDSYTEFSTRQITMMLGATIDSKDSMEIDGLKTISVDYKVGNPKLGLRLKQYWMVKDMKAYLITYTAKENTFDEFSNVVDKMAKSLRLP